MNEINYDVVLVGAGIANIGVALKLANTDLNVLLIEMGNPLFNRKCVKDKSGVCKNCKTCAITHGFAGAGAFSDCKLTYSPEVGGTVVDYLGYDLFNHYLNIADELFTNFGGSEQSFTNKEFSDKLERRCNKYNMHLIQGKVRHLGTDGTYKVMSNIFEYLSNTPNITMMFNTPVETFDIDSKWIRIKNQIINYKNIVFAVGRSGSQWLRQELTSPHNQGIKFINDSVDIGVRVECPRVFTDDVTDELYEFKIVNYSSSGNKVRTFCVNPGGYVVQENYDDIACVNGHSLSDNGSTTTNFALLVSCHFTEPFNQPNEYGEYICRLANALGAGKPIVQRLCDLRIKKRTNTDRVKKLPYEPTLKDCCPGDLRYILPANILDSIIETLDNLNNIFPGINGDSTILYAPEVKFYSSKIQVNNTFNPVCINGDSINNTYFIGDSSGITHGIMQSLVSGLYTGDTILDMMSGTGGLDKND